MKYVNPEIEVILFTAADVLTDANNSLEMPEEEI